MSLPAIGQRLDDYRLDRLVEQRRWGGLFQATQLSLNRPVCLEFLGAAVTVGPDFEERFQEETRRIAALCHPRLLPTYGAGRAAGGFYHVTRWVEGPSFDALLAAGVGLRPGLRLLAEAAAAVGAVHAAGLVHRRLAGARLLVADDTVTVGGLCPGFRLPVGEISARTAAGLAPEQARRERATPASDVWALGLLLYRLALGRSPYGEGGGSGELLGRVAAGRIDAADGCPPELAAVLQRALSLAPAARYADGAGLAAALETLIAGCAPEELSLAGLGLQPNASPDSRSWEATVRVKAPEASPGQERGARFGRYELLEVLGQGGMGIVYRARQPELDREVALKVLQDSGGLSAEAIERFQREARAGARLRHPNIVSIHEVGEQDGVHYFTMDLVGGGALKDWQGSGDVRETMRLMRDVCRGVGYAHEQGVIHRDLKPANVLIEPGDPPRPMVGDFGLAKLAQGSHDPTGLEVTRSGDLMGTPAYMSPEQAGGGSKTVDARSDVYSLGATLYHLLTGRPPVVGDGAMDVIRRVVDDDPAPPRTVNPLVPLDVETICLKALEKSPGRRYASAGEMAEDIGRWLDGGTLLARPRTRAYRLWRYLWRRRLQAALATGGVAALVLLVFGLWWGRRQELRAREAEQMRQLGLLHRELQVATAAYEGSQRRRVSELRQPNGELAQAAVEQWFGQHAELLGLLDRLAAIRRDAVSDNVRVELAGFGFAPPRLAVCRSAARMAARLGRYTLARAWVDRAVGPDVGAEDRRRLTAWIARTRRARIERSLVKVRRVLATARAIRKQTGWFEYGADELVRLRSPDLVRLLLSREYLDSPVEAERTLAIEVLGRIGDTRTAGEEGLDTVVALCHRLSRSRVRVDLTTPLALAQALGRLRDPRGHAALEEARYRAGHGSRFWTLTAVPISRIPVPVELRDERVDLFRLGTRLLDQGDPAGAVRLLSRAIQSRPRLADAYVHRALARKSLGDLAGALADLERAIQLSPRLAPAHANLGAVLLQLDRYQAAVRAFTIALSLRKDLYACHGGRAEAYGELGEFAAATADARRAVQLAPSSPKAHYLLGTIHLKARRFEPALKSLGQAIRLFPRFAKAYQARAMVRRFQGDLDGALVDLTEALKIQPLAQFYRHRAELYVARRSLRRAEADLTQALQRAPEAVQSLKHRSLVRQMRGNLVGADEDLARVLELRPADLETWRSRATLLIKLGKYRQARHHADRAIAIEPCAPMHTVRGYAQYMKGDAKGAMADYEAALRIDPRHGDALRFRGYLRLKLKDLDGALEDANALLAVRPSLTAYYVRARVQVLRRQPRKAIEDMDKAIGIKPGVARYHQLRGIAYQMLGKLRRALTDYTSYVKLCPEDGAGYYNRGLLYRMLGEKDKAMADFQQAVRHGPGRHEHWLYLGIAQAEKGDRKAAVESLREAHRLGGTPAIRARVARELRKVRGGR